MAGLQKHPGIPPRLVGPVEIGGDIEVWQTLENHFLDRIVLTLYTAANSGIQRTAVIGQTADQRQKGLADRLLPALRAVDIVNFGNGVFPPLQLLLRDLVHPPEKWVLGGLLSGERSEIEKSGKQR